MEHFPGAGETGFSFEHQAPVSLVQGQAFPHPPWLEELQSFRGRHLLTDPRYPDSGADRSSPDRDAFDLEYHHLLARRQGSLVGCIRLSPILSQAKLQDYLRSLGCPPVDTALLATLSAPVVCGRWVVEPLCRATGLGIRLTAGVHLLARKLGGSDILAMAGTLLGQDRILARIGARTFGGMGAFHAGNYGTVKLLRFNPWQVPKTFQGMLAGMESTIELPLDRAAEPILQAA